MAALTERKKWMARQKTPPRLNVDINIFHEKSYASLGKSANT